jgi:peptidoglycan/xylan/chitin deacetylase (PgdA/CDA1 family)
LQDEKASFFLGFCFLLTLFTVNAVTTRPSSRPEPIYQVEGINSAVFLTVDVLWQKDFLDEVLALLDERDVKAVFFITGEWLRENQQEAQKIIAYGHQLGNQTFSHSKLLLLTEEEIINEISKFNTLCQDLLNYQPIFFRPPYGEYNIRIVRIAEEQNLLTLLWSINIKTLTERETDLIISHLEESLHDGAVLLCHNASPQILQILPEALEFIGWKGYRIENPICIKEYAERKKQ